jgi:hypothetical protein
MEAKTIAKEGENDVYFVRDRDFDYLPPDDLLQPKLIRTEVITIPNNKKIKRDVKGSMPLGQYLVQLIKK